MFKTKKLHALFQCVLNFIFFLLFSCQSTNDNKDTPKTITQSPKIDSSNSAIAKAFETDTTSIENKIFVFSTYKNNSSIYLKIEREYGNSFKTILVDSSYTTNNSAVGFYDSNNDGYDDFNWYKKWQNHAYLFNPKQENFVEVGELHDIDTLKVNGKAVFFKNKFPLLYLQNEEKDFEFMVELHSELFILNDEYQKVSFATLDNFGSLEDWNFDKCNKAKSVMVNCYVPPYDGKYNETSIWNSGKSVDSIFMKSNKFDSSFIVHYWRNNYKGLMKYGQIFKVRRDKPLMYF